jgi:hypothetical protein
MHKSLSITVHPSALEGEYLTVADAMSQVLDLAEALALLEAPDKRQRKVVWHLTEAHTNSPPLTVTMGAFSADPAVSADADAERSSALFEEALTNLLHGNMPDWLDHELAAPIKRVLKRNLNGIGRTVIQVGDNDAMNIVPSSAREGILAIERADLDDQAAATDLQRTEFGSIEAEVCGLTRWYDRRALIVIERLSGEKVTCVLSHELAERLGPTHKWNEAWDSGRVVITGALQYGQDGSLKRIDADALEPLPWTDVPLSELRDIDLVRGRTVAEHIQLLRDE